MLSRAIAVPRNCWLASVTLSGQQWADSVARPTWQLVQPAYIRPDESASGYAVFANAVVAKLGETTFSNADLDGITILGPQPRSRRTPIDPTADRAPLEQLLLSVSCATT